MVSIKQSFVENTQNFNEVIDTFASKKRKVDLINKKVLYSS